MNHSFYAKREFRIKRKVYRRHKVYMESEAGFPSALTVFKKNIYIMPHITSIMQYNVHFAEYPGTPIYAKIGKRDPIFYPAFQTSRPPVLIYISIYFLLNEQPSVRRALPPVLR